MQQDLANNGFVNVDVHVTVEGDHFAFALTRGEGRRTWRWGVAEDVCHVTPDGTDPEQHAVWLFLLAEEENTDLVHRR